MHQLIRRILLACLVALGAATRVHAADVPAAPAAFSAEGIAFFEKKIRPLLVESCYECHSAGAKKIKGELRVDNRAALIKGGESGTSLTPGDPAKSRLIEAVTYRNADLQMPPKKKLSDEAIADLTQWVKMGAPWPAETNPGANPVTDAKPAVDFEARKREHWAWQPVRKRAVPAVKNEKWPRNEIDRFILAKLEEKELAPSREADPRTLIRRVTFDLIGLPPTPEEVDAFVKEWEAERAVAASNPKSEIPNPKSSAYSRLVDRLLASPQYGERWARHWLDVVRYADSKDSRGQGGEVDIPFAYRYRDWVIDAFNRDLPYDQFITQQIAGDLILNDRGLIHQPSAISHQPFAPLIATTMLAIGNWETGCSDKRKMMTDIVDDQVDVISRGFLGMTVACARCHDHKFDPITTRDYYALAGFFFSSHIIPAPGDPTAGTPMLRLPLMSEEQLASIKAAQAKVEELKKQINEQVDVRRREVVTRELARIKSYLAAAADLHYSDKRDEVATLSAIAAKHGVHAAMLKRFVRYLGMAGHGGTVRGLFTTKLTEVLGNKQISGWGSPDTPSVLAYTGREPVKVLTFTLPPRSVAMHPSPTKQVAIGWRSKFAGTVSITGLAADADANCGNGFDWSIVLKRNNTATRLAGGAAENGGTQRFDQSVDGKRLEAVAVQPGDLIALIIDAKGKAHECDTTIVDLIIRESTGAKRTWNLASDVVDSITASNPHADGHGNRDIWHFYAVATGSDDDDGGAVPPDSALAKWLAIVTGSKQPPASAKERETLAALAASIQALAVSAKPVQGAPGAPGAPGSPALGTADAALQRDLTAINGPVWATIDLLAYSEMDAAPLEAMRTQLAEQSKLAATKIEFAQGIREGGVPGSEHAGTRDAKVHIRGRYDRLGDVVPRGFPALIAAKPQAAVSLGSGRFELAKWIASPDNPMTARVMMNRLWQHHFGRGIVATPDNFGHLGDRPSHPQLLDHLAVKFVESGWSIKAMHKLIVTSATYMQASEISNLKSEVPNPKSEILLDPDNRLLWRQNRRRLDAEQLRDALLTAAGQLGRDTTLAAGPATADINTPRRTIYLMAVRSDTSNYRTLFDAADPTSSIHARNESTVAPQALFMLNHPFALAMTDAVSTRLLREAPKEDEKRIAWLYDRLFARPATPREIAIGLRVVREDASVDAAAAWRRYVQVLLCANEFVYVD